MLSKVRESFFGDYDVRFELENLGTHDTNFIGLLLKSFFHISFFSHLHVSLTFTLLVLKRAIKQQYARILDTSSHLRVSNILVKHYSIDNARLLKHATGHFLNLRISLDLDVELM